MRAIQSCMLPKAEGGLKGNFTAAPSANDLARVERLIRETRHVLGVLDRELDEIRASHIAHVESNTGLVRGETGAALMEAAPLPQNVVKVSRELFISEAPQEAVLDPELERATVDELNAALADAFNHVSGQ